MNKPMKVIDVGTKHGISVTNFLRKVKHFFPSYGKSITAGDCVGIDSTEDVRHDLEGQGFSFFYGDILDLDFRNTLASPDFFLVCNILHHIPNRRTVEELLGYVLDTTQYGVWFRLKSFETDTDSGEGILLEHGLRFGWSENCTSYNCVEVFQFIKERCPKATIRIEPGKYIRHTNDKRVVPVDTSSNSFYYKPSMGSKEHVALSKKVVCDWDIFVEK